MVFFCPSHILMNLPKPPRKDYIIIPVYMRVNADPIYTGKGITIAFIDSGFYPHPALESRIKAMVDMTTEKFSEDEFRMVRASSWHGTMVACVACGNGHFSKGYYRGIAHQANVVLIKAFDGKKVTSQNIFRSLSWVLKNHENLGIRIVNVSLGGEGSERFEKSKICRAVHALREAGITVIAAAGNNPAKAIIPPASCPDTISVGGIDDQNSLDISKYREYGSSFGYTVDGFMKPEIVAPSNLIPAPMVLDNPAHAESQLLHELVRAPMKELKAKLKRNLRKTPWDKSILTKKEKEIRSIVQARLSAEKFFAPYYQHVDGTSFAAPIVTSIVAQMLEVNPNLTPGLIKMILETTARRLHDIAPEKQGYGLITARACIERALEETHLEEIEPTPRVLADRIIFFYHDHDARKVTLVGDFTAWSRDTILFKSLSNGLWRVDIPLLSKGSYHYKFLVDDRRWVEDPMNPRKENDNYNGMNSVLLVS